MVKAVLVSVVVFIVAFFVLRGVMLWYWKINEMVTKLDIILAELKKISGKTEAR